MSWFFGLTGGKRQDDCVTNCIGYHEDALDDISRRCSKLAEMVTQWHVRKTEFGAVGWFSDMFGRRSKEVCLHDLAFHPDSRQILKDALDELRAAAPPAEETKAPSGAGEKET